MITLVETNFHNFKFGSGLIVLLPSKAGIEKCNTQTRRSQIKLRKMDVASNADITCRTNRMNSLCGVLSRIVLRPGSRTKTRPVGASAALLLATVRCSVTKFEYPHPSTCLLHKFAETLFRPLSFRLHLLDSRVIKNTIITK